MREDFRAGVSGIAHQVDGDIDSVTARQFGDLLSVPVAHIVKNIDRLA